MKALKSAVARIYRRLRGLAYLGKARVCPVCETGSRKFVSFGNPGREDARCFHCGAMERHRLSWLYLQRKSDVFSTRGLKVLHFAPEQWFQEIWKREIGPGYLSVDLMAAHAMEKADITDLRFPDEEFDFVYCSHVLEHVPDDIKAIAEVFRVTRRGGWAAIMVPVKGELTDEDPAVESEEERLRRFGQEDHVRQYGLDIRNRLESAGFAVSVVRAPDFLDKDEIELFGLGKKPEELFVCEKTAQNTDR